MNTFLSLIVVLLPLAASIYGLRKIFLALKKPAFNFAFNRKDIEQLSKLLDKLSVNELEEKLKQLNADDLSLALDHLSLYCSEKKIMKCSELSNQSACFELLYGIWHLHQAWKKRGHKVASELSQKQINQFIEHLKAACAHIETSLIDSKLATEAHSRLIRAYMSLGYGDTAREHFKIATASNPKHFWSFLHQSELIQSKWDGSEEEVKSFIKQLPVSDDIQMVVKLKLLYDGIMSSENYFDIDGQTVESMVDEIVIAYDSELEQKSFSTMALYMTYGYLYLLSSFSGNKALEKKYQKLIHGNYTLYPFGYIM